MKYLVLCLICFLAGILSVRGAPIDPGFSLEVIRRKYGLNNFHSSYFDKSLTKVCEEQNTNKIDNGLCQTYADVLIKLHERNCTEVTSKDWNELDKQPNDDSICEKLSEKIGLQKSNKINETCNGLETVYNKTRKPLVCKKMCYEENFDDNTENIVYNLRPICKFILFGYTEISKVPVGLAPASAIIESDKKVEEHPVEPGNFPRCFFKILVITTVNFSIFSTSRLQTIFQLIMRNSHSQYSKYR